MGFFKLNDFAKKMLFNTEERICMLDFISFGSVGTAAHVVKLSRRDLCSKCSLLF